MCFVKTRRKGNSSKKNWPKIDIFAAFFPQREKKTKKQKRDLCLSWLLLVHTFTIVLGNFFAHTTAILFVPNSSFHSSNTLLTTTVKNDDDDDNDDERFFFGCTHDAKICLLDEL
jgi:hypothetical protein